MQGYEFEVDLHSSVKERSNQSFMSSFVWMLTLFSTCYFRYINLMTGFEYQVIDSPWNFLYVVIRRNTNLFENSNSYWFLKFNYMICFIIYWILIYLSFVNNSFTIILVSLSYMLPKISRGYYKIIINNPSHGNNDMAKIIIHFLLITKNFHWGKKLILNIVWMRFFITSQLEYINLKYALI